MGRNSQLKSKLISKVWLNRKDYKFLDFDFKVTDIETRYLFDIFNINVYNYGRIILKIEVREEKMQSKSDERFMFKVVYFNPQTDNDCYSINHIIAVCSNYVAQGQRHKDMGNADMMDNQFVLRRRSSYFCPTEIWTRGEIKNDNYDKQLSYEFATNEYINYIKKIFEIKKIPRRKIKKNFKDYLNKIILLSKL